MNLRSSFLITQRDSLASADNFLWTNRLSVMSKEKNITAYNKSQDKKSREICELLASIISKDLPVAQGKVWHGHPVWFINENPVVGYSKKKAGIEILFWSGQSFGEESLIAIGKFKAAGYIYQDITEVKKTVVKRWLKNSKKTQWDYANLPKNRKLVKLTQF